MQDVTSPYYLTLPAVVKADRIWHNCLVDRRPAEWNSFFEVGFVGFTESMCPSYFTVGDELPSGRKKITHNVGVVGRVVWRNRGRHPYTGIFRGANHGMVRLSFIAQPNPLKPVGFNPRPSMGLKFLRNGMDSANLVAMFSLNGQQSWNFFRHDWTTHLPTPLQYIRLLPPGTIKFSTVTRNIRQVGTSDWGKAGEDGIKESHPRFPYRLRFRPALGIARRFSDSFEQQCQIDNYCDLRTIPPGSTLFHVFAMNKPTELGGRERLIGEVVLTSILTTSRWGDNGLFFRHQDMADDLQVHPEWNRYTPQEGAFSSNSMFISSPFRTKSCQAGGVRQKLSCPFGDSYLGGC